jgi:hypothetical protein
VESGEGSNLANQPLAIEQQKEQKLLKITSYNPIPLLTAKMEDVLNRPVSFRRFRENGMQTKRFYVRVGNIEILSSKG